MQRRGFLALAIAAGWGAGGAAHAADPELALYGLRLKDATAADFVAAALAAGGVRVEVPAGAPVQLDMRGAGVPALTSLTLTEHEDRVARVRFAVKGYGEDNHALRRLLQDKYGVPLTVGVRPLPYPAFDQRVVPRGAFQWRFAGGMRLVYEHPRLGDVTLTYVDDARIAALEAAGPAIRPPEPGVGRDRF